MSDGDAVGDGDVEDGIGAGENAADLFVGKPAGIGDLLRVDDEVVVGCVGEAADHEGGGERPRLGGEVADVINVQTGFLFDLATHGRLDGFTLVHVAGEAGVAPAG